MDALKLLKTDHDDVKKLMKDLNATGGAKRREQLFDKLSTALTAHEVIEEEIFYPALKEHPKAKEIVLEAYEEHDVVDRLLGDLKKMPTGDERWGAKATVMSENVEHHIEEEEREMFAQARQVFSAEELEDLGNRMAERKEAHLRDGARAAGRR